MLLFSLHSIDVRLKMTMTKMVKKMTKKMKKMTKKKTKLFDIR